ncbi:DUF192 domain-containing protein [uncultured Roseibium sp.]|uniref:DUF192 domain-containing protein n=1 Tax=uncultured Roseibium sp. TaxID=1936171 RepID=UPI00321700AF
MLRLLFPRLRFLFAAIVLSVGLSSAGLAAGEEVPLPTETLTIATEKGPQQFTVEVAATDAQKAKGLMYRERMALNEGMLFLFQAAGDRYFWMKNTPLSLDIIFIGDNGRIVHIAEGTTPFSEETISSRGPARYVLEVLAGTSRRLGIKPGDQVRSSSIK